jgi:hypothetical protein
VSSGAAPRSRQARLAARPAPPPPPPPPRDRWAERKAALAEVFHTYSEAVSAAWADYNAACRAAFDAASVRVDGAAAEYTAAVEHIRAAP